MIKASRLNALCAGISLALCGTALATPPNHERVIVKMQPGASSQVEGVVRGAGGQIHHRLESLDAMSITVPSAALQGLRNNPNILYIEEDAKRYPMAQTTPYGTTMVQAEQAWSLGGDGTGVLVCVIDSGVNGVHEDIDGITGGYPAGWDYDDCGHGTHVAGSIGASNNSTGVVGVAPNVSYYFVEVFSGSACGWSYSSSLIDAANRCAEQGSNSGKRVVINMSLGGGRASNTEKSGFDTLYNSGNVLSIAAAGNDGTSTLSYPASYDSVISVGALDSTKTIATFSQYNSQVELSAPGVSVLSTMPFTDASVSVSGASYMAAALEGSYQGNASAALVDGGRCSATNGAWSGKVVLCERGDISFADKNTNVQNSGGAATIIYNNEPGGFSGTLNGATSTIPSVSISQEDGQYLVANQLGTSASVSTVFTIPANGYGYMDGTSMASPHVAGVAAAVWSTSPTSTNADIRNVLASTAQDLGAAGRDVYYGYGLVQAADAITALGGGGGGGGDTNTAPTASFTYSCTDLACSFDGTGSSDSDGTITGYSWSFGASGSTANHTFSAAGTYTVTLTVTDDDGATHSSSQSVTVTAGDTGGGGIELSGSSYKVKGRVSVDLSWSGASSTNVDVFRNGSKVATTANDGAYTDSTGFKGGGSISYKLCEAGTSTCSAQITVIY